MSSLMREIVGTGTRAEHIARLVARHHQLQARIWCPQVVAQTEYVEAELMKLGGYHILRGGN